MPDPIISQNSLTIEQAKTWYQSTKSEPFITLKSSKADKISICDPDWKKAFTSSNDFYDVVETPIRSQTHFGFSTQESFDLSKKKNEPGYLTSLSRFVVQKNRVNQHIVGFIMTIIGETDYLKSKKFRLTNNSYLKMDKDFSGYVLYNDLNGKFVNGWLYKNGKLSGKVKLISPNQSSIRMKSTAEACTDVYFVVTTTYTPWEIENGELYIYSSYDVTTETYWYSYCYNTSGDGGYDDTLGGDPTPSSSAAWASAQTSSDFDKWPCVNEIYYTLLDSDVMYTILQGFMGKSPTAQLNWFVDIIPNNVNGDQINAKTHVDAHSTYITITLNQNYIDSASSISIARTMLHEAIHAEFTREWINENVVPLTGDVAKYADSASLKDWQHELMSQKYLDEMKVGLQAFDNNCNITNRDPFVYDALVWGGLYYTSAWNNLSPALQTSYQKEINKQQTLGGCK